MLVLVTGGVRSGKSSFAEQYAACLGNRGIYVATSQIWDEEMRERILLHKVDRESSGFPWVTIEEPMMLTEALERLGGAAAVGSSITPAADPASGSGQTVVLVDCLTLWLTNVLMALEVGEWTKETMSQASRVVEIELERLVEVLRRIQAPLLLVTNEVGGGIVPEYPLGRLFRDLTGRMNQRIAAECDQVFLVTAGIPIELKTLAFRLPDTSMTGK